MALENSTEPIHEELNESEIKAKTIDGAVWNVFFAVSNKIITLLGQLLLAWYLLPSDIGLANIAQATATFATILSVGGLGEVLVQRKRFEKEAGQAFWIATVFSALISFIIIGIALFRDSNQKYLLMIIALSIAVGSPIIIMTAELKSRLDYKWLAISKFSGGAVFTVSTVVLARLGLGPYSMIVPLIPMNLTTMLVMYSRLGKIRIARPNRRLSFELLRPTIALGLSNYLSDLQIQAPIFLCGILMGSEKTGYFSWGWMAAGQVVFLLALNLREILMPTFVSLNRNEDETLRVALKAARAMTAFLAIACGLQALVAGPFIHVFLPRKWDPAIPLIVIFSLGIFLRGVWISGMAWLNACGKYRQMVMTSTFQIALTVVGTWVGYEIFDLIGAASGFAISVLVGSVLCLGWGIHRASNYLIKWVKPILLTMTLWLACFAASKYFGDLTKVLTAVIFLVGAAYIWWSFDDGGIKIVTAKFTKTFKRR